MLIEEIIKKWSKIPDKSIEFILLSHYNKKNEKSLINLFSFKDSFWCIDKKSGNFYLLTYSIDNIKKSNCILIPEIEIKKYKQINYDLSDINNTNNNNLEYIENNLYISNFFEIEKTLSNKRKIHTDCDEECSIKKNKIVDWELMVSASSTRNYFLNDPLLDWIKEFNIESINQIPKKKIHRMSNNENKNINNFESYIMNEGIEFEKQIIKKIKDNHNVVQVAESYQSRDISLFEKTVDLMKDGIKIIYQGILHNYYDNTYGSPDLLIRSDFINEFFGFEIYSELIESKKINRKYHYVVVDIKHSNIHLRSDGIHILNIGSSPAYKGQLLVYTKALNEILGTNIQKAFILGKKYTYESKGEKYEINDPFKKLGVINYSCLDFWVNKKLEDALFWLRDLRKNGHTWKLIPPSRPELYPNMKNDKDSIHNKIKKDLAIQINEISSVYFCSPEKRQNAFEKGVVSWKDPKCTSQLMGFTKGIISKRVDAILNINRSITDIIRPKKILSTYWKNIENEFYLDFETLNSSVGPFDDFIFMIGIGHIVQEKWVYKVFIAPDNTEKSELQIIKNFLNYVDNFTKTPTFIHWSQAEKSIYDKKISKYDLPFINFFDLNKFFLDETIVIKGSLNWSLKSIAKAMYQHGFINTIWKDDGFSDGLQVMFIASQLYNNSSLPLNINNNQTINSIIQYNEIDCKSMYEILTYLKLHN
jgi:hypothetical protein